MKLRLALVGLVALGGAALTAGTASAMPLAPLFPVSNVESIAVVCGPNGCIRTRPVYRRMATAFVAMAMCVQPTDTAGSPLVIG